MGISGLLPLLKSIQKPCNLKKFSGQTIGVDAYGWLHRGTAACAIDLALEKPTTKFVDFAMHRVRMLIHFGITPYLVFDGDNLPSKAGTEKERRDKRKEGKRLGMELLKVGKTSQAHIELQKAVNVTPEMARMLIEELKRNNIQYVVAPYEADSQLAYLERKGIISGVLSEDSDLLVFGVKCLITKLDKYGECVEVNRNHFTACREISLVGWTDTDFRRMAILSGCDYLPGIGSMGLKTAHRMLRKHKTVDRLVKAAQFDGKFKVPPGFMQAFDQAEKTFLHQWVFCPLSNRLVNLTPLNEGVDIGDMPFLGQEVPAQVAIGVACGDLHPSTRTPIIVESKTGSMSKPLMPARRTSSNIQTPDLKQSKPIDTFFKPKRTPLAELDPNSFTPSPSQQALLQQSNNTWVAVPAPQSQSHQGSSIPRTAPHLARRAISDSTGRRQSAPNPSKRQRLCSDSVFDTPDTASAEITRSRFFASTLPDPSPSIRTGRNRRKKTSHDFELYSDDSVENVMAELADFDEAMSQPKKKMKVFKDDFGSSVDSDSQSTIFSKTVTETSQESVGTLTPATSYDSPEPESIFASALSSQVKDLRSRFSFKSTGSSLSTATSTASQSDKSTQSNDIPATTTSETSTVISQQPRSKITCLGTPPLKDNDNELEDSAWAVMEAEIVVAASDTESKTPSKLTSTKKSPLRGSEDLLVPDSEAESDCSPRKPMFSLRQFAFAA